MTAQFVSRGFQGRRRSAAKPLPPGQYLTRDFPVLSAGPTPRTPLDLWTFRVEGLVSEPKSWTWGDFLRLPAQDYVADIHCVTKWSKFDTHWEGVSVDTLLAQVQPDVKAQLDALKTRCLHSEHDRVCGNESAFYPPLARGVRVRPAAAAEHVVNGTGLRQTYTDYDRRGAYVGTFEVR